MTSNLYTPKIYLYSFRAGRWIAQFDTEEKLLEYFVRNYSAFFGSDNEVNLTWNDTKTCVDPLTGKQKIVLRDYVMVDESDRVVDPARYKDGVEALMKGLSEAEMERMKAYEHMGLLHIWRRWSREVPLEHENLSHGDLLCNDKTSYRFRCDPVPGTHHNRWHFCNHYRYPKTIGELRLMADPEDGAYIRPKRRYIPTAYDDIPRGRQRSWKEQSKRAKQWSKNKSRTSKEVRDIDLHLFYVCELKPNWVSIYNNIDRQMISNIVARKTSAHHQDGCCMRKTKHS